MRRGLLTRVADTLREKLVLSPIYFYRRYISPLRPGKCRFIPSCSRFAIDAIRRFGTVRGLVMATCRFLRCNPLCKGGYDPVPERFSLRPFAAAHQQARGNNTDLGENKP